MQYEKKMFLIWGAIFAENSDVCGILKELYH